MASVGLDTGGSQFYVSLSPSPQMNGRCVVFGRMEPAGEPVLAAIEKVRFWLLYDCLDEQYLILYMHNGFYIGVHVQGIAFHRCCYQEVWCVIKICRIRLTHTVTCWSHAIFQ